MPRQNESYKRLKKWLLSDDGIKTIEQMAADNLTIKEIAQAIGISQAKLKEWIDEDDAIGGTGRLGDAMERSSQMLNYAVQSKLYESALGAETKTIEIVQRLRKNESNRLTLQTTEKHTIITKDAPNTAAAKFILTNKMPNVWKDKRVEEIEQTDDLAVNINIVRAEDNSEVIESSIFQPDPEEIANFEKQAEDKFDEAAEWDESAEAIADAESWDDIDPTLFDSWD